MTCDDVSHIETRLGMVLPIEYRDFVLNFPDDLDLNTVNHELWNDPNTIIEATSRLRFGEILELQFPREMIVIGDSGCGDYYCLDFRELPAPVLCWNHEISDFEYTASSIQSWYIKVKAMQA